MKGIHLVSLIALSLFAVRCADPEPVATGYKKSLQSQAEGNPAIPTPNNNQGNDNTGNGDQQAGGDQPAGDDQPAGGEQPAGGAGDAAAGKTLFTSSNCGQCHPGLKPLNSTSSVEKAAGLGIHDPVKAAFDSPEKKANLQAHINTL